MHTTDLTGMWKFDWETLKGKDNLRDEGIEGFCGSMCVNVCSTLGQSPVGVCTVRFHERQISVITKSYTL